MALSPGDLGGIKKGGNLMSPREIIMEHIHYWTSEECRALSPKDSEFVMKLAELVGVKLAPKTRLEIIEQRAA
jgi:hypothetical protein